MLLLVVCVNSSVIVVVSVVSVIYVMLCWILGLKWWCFMNSE